MENQVKRKQGGQIKYKTKEECKTKYMLNKACIVKCVIKHIV